MEKLGGSQENLEKLEGSQENLEKLGGKRKQTDKGEMKANELGGTWKT